MSLENYTGIISEDPLRCLIRDYMAKHPEEEDLSIHPDRGTFSERHQGLVQAIKIGAAMRKYTLDNYKMSEIYQLINEEQERR